MKTIVLALLCCSIYSSPGIAATPAELLDDLQPVKTPKYLHVKNPIRITTKNDLNSSVSMVNGLAIGLYVAAEENAHGTFFKGPGRSVVYGNGQINFIQTGGLWVPKASDNKKLKLYIYMGPENQRRYSDLPAAYAAQHEPVEEEGSTASEKQQTKVITVTAPVPLSTGQAYVAGGIATALIAVIDAESIRRNRGKARFLHTSPDIDYDSIKDQIEFVDTIK